MGKPRKSRLDLPERVYQKHGAYYYVTRDNKWKKLDRDYSRAMVVWAELIHTVSDALTVDQLINRYLIEVVPNKAARTQKDNREEARWLRAFFGKMNIEDVETKHVVSYVTTREAKTRANREVALLSHMFTKAILWGLTKTNPCSTGGIRNKEKARSRYVTDDELEQFKQRCPLWLQIYIELKLATSLRQGDLLNLQWSNLENSLLTVTLGKTQKRMTIALNPELVELLNSLPRSSKTIFTNSLGRMYTSTGFSLHWRKAMVSFLSSGGEKFNEHDLRGKTATDMDDPVHAQKLLGHANMQMTEVYIKQRKTDVVQSFRRKK
jgi:integrase